MNRVRVVAITAVVLGVAVVAGTQFQNSRGIGAAQEQSASAISAPRPSVVPAVQTASVAQPAATQPVPPAVASLDLAVNDRQSAPVAPEAAIAPVLTVAADPADLPESSAPQASPRVASASILPAAELVAAAQTDAPEVVAPSTTASDGSAQTTPLDAEVQAALEACAVWIVVTPSAGAMLDVSVYAPCDRDAPVQVSHAGLTFDTRIGADGQMMLLVPALVDDATLTVTFADGRTHSDRTFVPDLASIDRVALQWAGSADLMLHAYEFGAQYGEAGHVFAGNPRAADSDEHGYLSDLGDPTIADGDRVQVYSYPTRLSSRSGSVALEIEVPVTAATCGRPLDAVSLEMYGTAAARTRIIHLDMPDCDGVGGYVVMPGVLPDLQIAALR